MLRNKLLFAATLSLLMLLGTPVFAGPVSTAQAELTKYAAAVKGSATTAQKRAVRRAQAHLLVARAAKAAGKPVVAKGHALAARGELLAVKATVKLTALTAAQKTAKASATAAFTTALARMPTTGLLGVSCSGSRSPCGQSCCAEGERCGDGSCHARVSESADGVTSGGCPGGSVPCGQTCCNTVSERCGDGKCRPRKSGVTTDTSLTKETAE